MATPSPNPWLRWIYEHDVAPHGFSVEATLEAMGVVDRAFQRTLRQFLKQPATLERYRAFQEASHHHIMLHSWAAEMLRFGARRDQRQLAGPLHQFNQRFSQRWNRMTGPKHPYQSQLAKLEGKLRRAGERDWVAQVAGERSMDGSLDDPERSKRMAGLLKTLTRRQEKLSAHNSAEGGVHLRTWPGPPNSRLQAEAREGAQARGLRGYVVLAHTDAERFLLYNAYETSVRRRLWEQRQNVALRPQDIETLRTLRQEEADAYASVDWATMVFGTTLFTSPSRAERWLGGALDRLRKPLHAAMETGTAKLGVSDEEARLPWNFRHTLQSRAKPHLAMPDQAFPWRSTALKIIPELVALGGWSCLAAPALLGRGNGRMLRFRLRHQDGRRAQLFYAPFNPAPKVGDQTGALCMPVRTAQAHAPDTEAVVLIEHYLQPQAELRGLNLDEIGYLCHELGHALHYLALPGKVEHESNQVPLDFVEVPALLLEQYYRQPETLVRWLGHKAPGALRHPAYWARRLVRNTEDAVGFHVRIYRPYVDLRLSRKHTGPLTQVLAEADARGGFTRHPQQREELDYFDAHEGPIGFSHIAGNALAHRLVPVHEHGQVSSTDVGNRFTALLETVLTTGVDARTLHRGWRQLTGESMRESMERGIKSLTQRECRVLRHAR